MSALARLKLTDDTVVIFTSDNGGTQQYTSPLRGSKGQLYEGGIRVPLVVSWPGLKKPGSVCQTPVSSIGRITMSGSITLYPITCSPQEIAPGPDGAMWFTCGDTIGRITTN